MNYIKITLRAIIGILSIFAALKATAQCGHTFYHDSLKVFSYEYKMISEEGHLLYESNYTADYIVLESCNDGYHNIKFYVDGVFTDKYVIHSRNKNYAITHEGDSAVVILDMFSD